MKTTPTSPSLLSKLLPWLPSANARAVCGLLGCILLGLDRATAAPGEVDTGYNAPAVVGTVNTMVTLPDGKALLGGSFSSVGGVARSGIARLNANGNLDPAFTPAAINGAILGMAAQGDGKVVICGNFTTVGGVGRSYIARLNADGTLDTGFVPPTLNAEVLAVLIQPDGKIVIGGSFVLAENGTHVRYGRLNADGSIDGGFNGALNGAVRCLALLPDGRIVVGGDFTTGSAGSAPYIDIVNTNGTGSDSFNGQTNGSVTAVAVQADGNILLGGNFTQAGGVTGFTPPTDSRNFLARMNQAGGLDAGFNPNPDSIVTGIQVQANGKIILDGNFFNVGGVARPKTMRININGSPDTSFAAFSANGPVNRSLLMANGSVLIAGGFTTVGPYSFGGLAMVANDAITQELTAPTNGRVQWLRGSTAPDAQHVTFELSTNGGVSFQSLGAGTRISGGWERTGLSLPGSGQLRARAFVNNRATGIAETVGTFSGLPAPEIALEQPAGTNLLDGTASVAFGSSAIATAGAPVTFTVRNTGSQTLTLGALTVDGAHAADFAVSTLGSTSLASGTSTTFSVTFTPSAAGTRTAALHLVNNDLDETPFDINLTGTLNNIAPGFSLASATGATVVTVDTGGTAIVGRFASQAIVNGNPAIAYYDASNGDLLYVRATNPTGTNWGPPVVVDATGNVGVFPSLEVVNGNPAIAYYEYVSSATDSGASKLKYVRAGDASGSAWGAPLVLDAQTSQIILDDAFFTGAACLKVVNGNPAVAYQEGSSSTAYESRNVYFVRATDASGGTWGTPQNLTPNGPSQGYFARMEMANGTPLIVDIQGSQGGMERFKATDASGTTWSGTGVVTPDQNWAPAGYPLYTGLNLALNIVAGFPALSYYEITQADLRFTRSSNADGTTWPAAAGPSGANQLIIDSAGDVGRFSSLQIIHGKPAISYYDKTNGDLKYVTASAADGTGWGAPQVLDNTGDVGSHTSMRVLASGAPGIAYFDATGGNLKYATLGAVAGGTTVPEDSGPSSVPGLVVNISPGPASEASQVVDFIVTNNNNTLFSSQPVIAANGTLDYTPAPNANGTATVSIAAHDNGGTANGGSDTSPTQTFVITVTAVNDAPLIALVGSTPLTLEAAATYTDAGATASDVEDGALTPVITTNTVIANLPGSYAFTWSATDSASVTVTATRTIHIVDTLAPAIASHANVTVNQSQPEGAIVSYDPAVATDGGGVTSLTYSQNSGTLFPVGTTVITITAKDAADHTSTSTFTVTVTAVQTVLSNLTLSSGILSPTFAPTTMDYTILVNESVTSLSLTPFTTTPGASIVVDGVETAAGTASVPIALNRGSKYIAIWIFSASGVATYNLDIFRGPSLAGLTLGAGTVSPAIDPLGYYGDYAVTVPDATGSITFTPTGRLGTETIRINGVTVASGATSPPIALPYGLTRVVVETIDSNGDSQAYYSFKISRGTVIDVDPISNTDSGFITSNGYTANGILNPISGANGLTYGRNLRLINNTSATPIQGSFSNLVQGQTFQITLPGYGEDPVPSVYSYVVNYFGGTGNDLVLQPKFGSAIAWGTNGSGQLGTNATGDRLTPAQVNANPSGVLYRKPILAESAGGSHSLALLADGSVVAWGLNLNGQLGTNSTIQSLVPVAVAITGVPATKQVAVIAAGTAHSLALCSDGTLYAWGLNTNGQLGNNATAQSLVPVAINSFGALAGQRVTGIAAGASHSLALLSDGTVVAWGLNSNGQLGNNSTTQSLVPVAVNLSAALAGKAVSSIAAGAAHSLALLTNGTAAAWGQNANGQLGNGSNTQSNVPVAVNVAGVLSGKSVASIVAGGNHNLALCSDHTLVAWGLNSDGQLGNSSTTSSNVPVWVATAGVLGGRTVASLAAGASHSLALATDGSLSAWGNGANGRLGNNATSQATEPVRVDATILGNISGNAIGAIASGPAANHSLAFKADNATDSALLSISASAGEVYASATNPRVEVPFDVAYLSVTPVTSSPGATIKVNNVAQTNGSASPLIKISSLTLNPGRNGYLLPVTVLAEDGVTTLTTEIDIRSSGRLAIEAAPPGFAAGTGSGWGRNTLNQATAPSNVTFTSLAAGLFHSVGLKADGTVSAWGYNVLGQINVPSNLRDVVAVDAANFYTMALKRDGTVLAWGDRPVVPAGLSQVKGIAAGMLHCLALKTNGTVVAWGDNSQGQLNVPVGLANVVAVSAGDFHSVALKADGTVVCWGSIASAPVGLSGVRAIDAGPSYVLALKTDGTVVEWPDNVNLAPPAALGGVMAIAAGTTHGLALKADGSIVAWGDNSYHQCDIPAGLTNVCAIAAGGNHSLAVKQTATTFSLGTGYVGVTGTPVAFSLRNVGNLPLSFLDMSEAAGDGNPTEFVVTGLQNATLAPGAAVTFTVAFKPTATGVRAGALRIYQNYPTSVMSDIVLSGSALPTSAIATAISDWAAGQGLTGAAGLPTATPFNDSVSNLLKFAFNMALSGPNTSVLSAGSGVGGLPVVKTPGNGGPPNSLTVEFVRRRNSGLVYTPLYSVNSLTAPVPMTGIPTVTAIDGDWERVVFVQPVPTGSTSAFSRVAVTIP